MLYLNSVRMAPGVRSALALACGLALSAVKMAWAGEESVEPVVVTATRVPTRISNVVADTTVIDRAQIERAAGRSLASLLADAPGLQTYANGGLGKSSNVLVRGGDAKQTLLLVDGVRYGSATSGAPALENIPLDLIDRIEIVRGPLASLYGADAASGVIQIFTRKGKQGFVPNASVTLGSDRYIDTSLGFSGGQDQLTYSINASKTSTSGFSATNAKASKTSFNPDRDGFDQTSVSARVGYALTSAWRLDGTLLRSKGVTDIDDGPAAAGRALRDTNTDLVTAVSGLSLTGRIGDAWRTIVRISQTEDVGDTQVANQSSYLSRIATKQDQLTWDNQISTPAGQFLVAVEHLKQEVDNSTIPLALTSRTINALVLGLTGNAGAHDWQLSAREDRNSQFGNESTSSIAYGYALLDGLKVGGSMGTSFVAPSFNQLYYPQFGKPDLKPQHGFNKEVNLKWTQEGQDLSLVRYDNRIKDFIQTSQTSVSNLSGVRLSGWTLAGTFRQATGFGGIFAGGSLDWLDAHNVATDAKLVRRADRVASLRSGLEYGAWSYEVSVRGSSGAPDTDPQSTSKSVRLPGYALWGAAIRYNVSPDWTLALRGDNLGNHAYETARGFNQPLAQVFLTLSYAPKRL